jgi:hypothetical protein
MLREEVYHKMAREFQTAIGTALPIVPTNIPKNQVLTQWVDSKEDKKELEVNRIILKAIEADKYQSLFRKVYDLEKRVKNKRIQKSTIYKKAWKVIYGTPNQK